MIREALSNWRADLKELFVLGFPVLLANAMRIAFFVTNNAFIVRIPSLPLNRCFCGPRSEYLFLFLLRLSFAIVF